MSGRALLIVMSAPSGAGKSTLCDRLLAEFDDIIYSISCTTRSPRGAEIDGEDYFFLSKEEFAGKLNCGLFLEYAEVHGHMYATLKETVRGALSDGCSVIMDIDVKGADQIREYVKKSADGDLLKTGFVDIFVLPPSLEILRKRLLLRGEDTDDAIEKRLQNAEAEIVEAGKYMYRIINDDLELAYRKLRDIVLEEKAK